MAKKVVEGIVAELKKLLADEKLVLGAERTMKLLREGKLSRVLASSNCNPETLERVEHLCSIRSVPVEQIGKDSEEIGVICRKPFSISLVGVLA